MQSKIDLGKLIEEASRLEFWLDGAGVEMSITQSGGIPDFIGPTIRSAIGELEDYRKSSAVNLMINRLPAGVTTPTHRDFIAPMIIDGRRVEKPIIERWHLPIVTNPDCFWWGEIGNKEVHFPLGVWTGPVSYWKKHYVKNGGTTERTHLVVDLALIVPGKNYEEYE